MPVSFTIRLCCKRKVTEATASGYCLSTASNLGICLTVRNLFDSHINLMHPHHWMINRGEKFSLFTEEHLGITFLFPPAAFPLCSIFFFTFSPGVYTHHLSSFVHILKGTTKSSSNCILSSWKNKPKNTQGLPGIQRAPLCTHHSPRPEDSCSYTRECFLYSCLQHRNKRLGKQQYPSNCQPYHQTATTRCFSLSINIKTKAAVEADGFLSQTSSPQSHQNEIAVWTRALCR